MSKKKVLIIGGNGHGIGAAISRVLAQKGIEKHEVTVNKIGDLLPEVQEGILKSLEVGRGEELVLPFIRRPYYVEPFFQRTSKYDCVSKNSHKRSNFRKKR